MALQQRTQVAAEIGGCRLVLSGDSSNSCRAPSQASSAWGVAQGLEGEDERPETEMTGHGDDEDAEEKETQDEDSSTRKG